MTARPPMHIPPTDRSWTSRNSLNRDIRRYLIAGSGVIVGQFDRLGAWIARVTARRASAGALTARPPMHVPPTGAPSEADRTAPALKRLNRDIRRYLITGSVAIAALFGGLGTWAALAPLDSAAMAEGVVVVDSRRKTVQHLEGGIIREIRVREGDRVKAGDVLVRLDDTRARTTFDMLQFRHMAGLAERARLLAERDDRAAITFPAALIEAGDADVRALMEGEGNVFETRRTSLAGEIALLDGRIAQSRDEIVGLEAQVAAEDRQIAIIDEEIAIVKQLLDSGNARRPRYLGLLRGRAQLEGSRGDHLAQVARVKKSIGDAARRKIHLRNERQAEIARARRDVNERLIDLQERIGAAADVLARIDIRAEQPGVVVELRYHTVGGVIGPRDPILDIVPQDDRLIVEVRIRPEDIDVVHIGLPAQIRLTAYSSRKTPPLEASVVYVAADRMTDPRTGDPYFVTHVQVDDAALKRLGDVKLSPGMTATAMIHTGSGTALDYLVDPIYFSFSRAFRED